jgi:hypothetical protein
MRTFAILCLACLLFASAASAQKVPGSSSGEMPPRIDCITDGYDAYTGGTGGVIPDDDVVGLTFGPMSTTAGEVIQDVILEVNMSATWIGDVRLWLLYDVEPDGTTDITGELLCRPGLAGCPEEDCCGCSGNLLGWYGFDDTAASIEDNCPSQFPPGCYGPDYDSSGLDVFDGQATGGDFYLFCADGAGGDVTEVIEWNVFVLTELTPVAESTWGHVKALYR